MSNPLSLSDNEHLRSKVQAVYQEEMLVLVSVKICTDKCENLSFSCALKCEIMLKKNGVGGGWVGGLRLHQSGELCLRKSNDTQPIRAGLIIPLTFVRELP